MPANKLPFQIRGRFLTALAIRIDTDDAEDDGLYERLDEQRRLAPQFFDDAPIVLDMAKAPRWQEPDRIRALVAELRRRKLRVFGVQNATRIPEATLQDLGLIPVAPGRDAPLPAERHGRGRTPAAAPAPVENKLIRAPVRSGQLIVCERGDLTVIGSVASGAELIASGNIHVYGPLRGRAMAGVHGDEDARIFCRSLEAELVAIAGLYQTNETIAEDVRGRATHIHLEDERLRMEVIR